MSDPIILYRFRVRHELTGKVLTTRYHLTDDEALGHGSAIAPVLCGDNYSAAMAVTAESSPSRAR